MTEPDSLFEVLSHPDFLAMKGLANEVPIFIKTYAPKDEETMQALISATATRLENAGIPVAVVDLFDLVLDIISAEGRLEKTLEAEPGLSKRKMLDMLIGFADPESRIIPLLADRIGQPDIRLSLIKGAGSVYPFLRTHTLLESLQPAMRPHPVVMFFPGEYTQDENGASQLKLFGPDVDSSEQSRFSKPYYRAFNLDHYRI